MSIESDIKQLKPFKSLHQKVSVNIIFTNNWLNANNAEILKPFGLTSQQYNVLRILRGQHPNPATVNAIIERMLDKMSNASRLVDKLLAKNLVVRQESKDDRRACDVIITEKGLEILKKIDDLRDKWEKKTNNLSPEENEKLSSLLDKLRGSE